MKALLGKSITLRLPNGEDRNAQFAIVELSDIVASHNEYTFATSPQYPLSPDGHNINDRNYSGDKQAQAQVAEYAHKLQPDRLISTSRTPSGTPIIDKNGIVVSGNNRTMSIKRAVRDYPQNYFEYVQFLKEEIEAFGFRRLLEKKLTSNDVKQPSQFTAINSKGNETFKQPILVRIDYDIPALNTAELAKYNMDTKKGKRPIDKAIELSSVLRTNPGCRDGIANILSAYERMSDFYTNASDQKKVIDFMVKCSLVTEQERPEYWTPETGFSQGGKQFLESVLASVILKKDALVVSENEGVKEFRRVLVTSLPALMSNQTLTEGAFIDDLNLAILLQSDMKQSGLPFSSQLSQISAFGDARLYTMKSLYLNRLIDKGQRRFKAAVDRYNNSVSSNAGTSMFETEKLSPSDVFEKVIMVDAMRDNKDAPIEQKAIDQYLKTHLLAPVTPSVSKPKVVPKSKPLYEVGDIIKSKIYNDDEGIIVDVYYNRLYKKWAYKFQEGTNVMEDVAQLVKKSQKDTPTVSIPQDATKNSIYSHEIPQSSKEIEAEIKTIQARLNKKGFLNHAEKELLNKKLKTLRANYVESKAVKSSDSDYKFYKKAVFGDIIPIKLINGETHRIQYAMVEKNDVIASHNEIDFSQNMLYPKNADGSTTNDRDYATDTDSQRQIIEGAKNINVEKFFTITATPSGTPIVNADGIAYSGNKRTQIIKRATTLHLEQYQKYRDFLCDNHKRFGFTECSANASAFRSKESKELTYFIQPILIRIDLDAAPYTNEESAKYNKKESVEYPFFDDKGNRRIDNEALEALEKHLATLPQTKELHTKNGVYTPERKELHRKIIKEMESGNTCIKRGKPICVFTGGAPGSGKSTFLKKNYAWLINPSIFHIDADEVRAKLPEYKGWNAAITHDETQDIVNELIDYIAPKTCQFDCVIDGTFTNLKKYRAMIKKVQDLGYETYGIFMNIAPEISMKRALERYQRAGRFVPRSVIKDVNSKGDVVFQELKDEIDGWVEVDGVSSEVTAKGGKELPKERDYKALGTENSGSDFKKNFTALIEYLRKDKSYQIYFGNNTEHYHSDWTLGILVKDKKVEKEVIRLFGNDMNKQFILERANFAYWKWKKFNINKPFPYDFAAEKWNEKFKQWNFEMDTPSVPKIETYTKKELNMVREMLQDGSVLNEYSFSSGKKEFVRSLILRKGDKKGHFVMNDYFTETYVRDTDKETIIEFLKMGSFDFGFAKKNTPSVSNPKKETEELVEVLGLSLNYLAGKEKSDTEMLIETLELSIQYL